ncbi:MAG: hypothetical protein ACE5IR_12715 [bacterium]
MELHNWQHIMTPSTSRFFADMVAELEKQKLFLTRLLGLLQIQKKLREHGEFYHFNKMNRQKSRLFSEIQTHKNILISMQKMWDQQKNNFSDDMQSHVLMKVEELTKVGNKILTLKKETAIMQEKQKK